jgi:glycine/D-amino acid oxidase-like deaminating enzyme
MSTASADGTAEVPQKIAIVGGGLAGLSTAFHLLEKASQLYPAKSLDVTILDSHQVGTGGASAVAGG